MELIYLCDDHRLRKVEVMGKAVCEFVPFIRFRDLRVPAYEGRVTSIDDLTRVATLTMNAVDVGGRDVFFELCACEVVGRDDWIVESGAADTGTIGVPVSAILHCVVVWKIGAVIGSASASCEGTLVRAHISVDADVPWSDSFEPRVTPGRTLAALDSSAYVLHPRTLALLQYAHALRTHHRVDFSGIFEIHVTVSGGPGAQVFTSICGDLHVKTILIELNSTTAARLPDQLMTASHHTGDCLFDVQRLAYDMAQRFLVEGFKVERVKVEAMMSSEGVPESDEDARVRFSPSNYFEFHVKVQLPLATVDYAHLGQLCTRHKAHLSRNALKQVDKDNEHRFVTLRLYHIGRATARGRFEACVDDLEANNYTVISKMREYSVYDSNVQLDSGWIDKSR